MLKSNSTYPQISSLGEIVFVSLASRSSALPLLNPLLQSAAKILCHRNPILRERLQALGSIHFLIIPTDSPFQGVLRLHNGFIAVDLINGKATGEFSATLRATVKTFIELLSGQLDGDAAFFSRRLMIEGDTEAVLVLRNALENSGIALPDDFLSVLGPMQKPAKYLSDGVNKFMYRIRGELTALQYRILAPAAQNAQRQAGRLDQLEARLIELEKNFVCRSAPEKAVKDNG